MSVEGTWTYPCEVVVVPSYKGFEVCLLTMMTLVDRTYHYAVVVPSDKRFSEWMFDGTYACVAVPSDYQ